MTVSKSFVPICKVANWIASWHFSLCSHPISSSFSSAEHLRISFFLASSLSIWLCSTLVLAKLWSLAACSQMLFDNSSLSPCLTKEVSEPAMLFAVAVSLAMMAGWTPLAQLLDLTLSAIRYQPIEIMLANHTPNIYGIWVVVLKKNFGQHKLRTSQHTKPKFLATILWLSPLIMMMLPSWAE